MSRTATEENWEVAELRRDKIELEDQLAITRTITENAADAIFLLDAEGRTTFANAAAEQMFGWSADELKGRKLHDLVHYRHLDGRPFPMAECPLGQVFATGRSLKLHEDVFFRKDGSAVHVACSNAAIKNAQGIRGGVIIVRDITERYRAEEHRQLLVNELNHRVKNMLAIIQSIAQQSFKGSEMAASRAAFEGRLVALSAAHDILNESTQNSASLRQVIIAAVRPFSTDEERLSISGRDIALPAATAVALSMAIHELATNATKYGALSNSAGRVSIQWKVSDVPQRWMSLVWQETNGPPVVKPSRRGFGSRMIERVLASELHGSVKVDFAPEGLVCSVEAPIASGI